MYYKNLYKVKQIMSYNNLAYELWLIIGDIVKICYCIEN